LTGAILALLLAAPAAAADYPLPAPPPGRRIDYSAERVDYSADDSIIHLSTGVVVRESTWTVKGDDMRIDVNRRLVTSDGPVILETPEGAAFGQAGEFDLADHTGTLFEAASGTGDWRIRGPRAALDESGAAAYRDADFTSCDAVPPHYHFHATTVTLVPRSAISAWNVLMYLGDVPVFYFPYFYHDLSPDHFLRWKLQPGDDNRNGAFVRSTLVTSYPGGWSTKAFADYYGKQGPAGGGELNYRDPHDKENGGGLYAYNVDQNNGDDRWTIIGADYQALPSSTSFQSRLQLQSDPDFNNDYVRSSAYTVPQNLVNNAAIDRRFDGFAARVIYSREDILNSTGTILGVSGIRYQREDESLPRLEFQTESLDVLGLPWLNSFSGYADNNYDFNRGFTQKSASLQWEATKGFNLWRGATFTPRTDISETGYDQFGDYIVTPTTVTYTDVGVARWSTTGDLRENTRFGNIDLRDTYAERLEPNGIGRDAAANDHGIEQNDLQLSDLWLVTPALWTRLAGGFNFQNYNDRTLGTKDRIEPLVGEATWTPNANLTAALRGDYQFDAGLRALIAYFNYGDGSGPSLGGGFEHNLDDPQNYYQSFNFAVAPASTTWKVIANMSTVFDTLGGPGRLHGLRLYEKDVAVIKTWHDFITKVVGSVRPGGVGEVSVSATLRLGTTNGRVPPRPDWERQFFPSAPGENEDRP
jgi:hypothetical protein